MRPRRSRPRQGASAIEPAGRLRPITEHRVESSRPASFRAWVLPIVLVDLWLVLVTSVNRLLPALEGVPLFDQPGGWLPLEPFNLGRENNLAAWWSTACLALVGLHCWELAGRHTRPGRSTWAVLAALFLGLSADEGASLHERVELPGGWIPGAVLGVLLVARPLLALHREPSTRRAARLIVLGLGCFALVAGMEFLERRIYIDESLRGLRAGLEEGLELLGQLLLLLAVVGVRVATPSAGEVRDAEAQASKVSTNWAGRRSLMPDPTRLPALGMVALLLLCLHAVAVTSWVPGLDDFGARADPSAWAPSLLLLVAACGAAWACWRGAATCGLVTIIALLGASAEQLGRPTRHLVMLFPQLPERALLGTASLLGAALLLLAAAGTRGAGRGVLLAAALAQGAAAWWLDGSAESVVAAACACVSLAAIGATRR